MQKNILRYGLISGIIVSATMLLTMNYYSHCEDDVNWTTSMLLGYASMLIAFSLIYVAIRNYRDRHNKGVISFGKAFQMGLFISLIASTMYVLSWLIFFYGFHPDFMDKYSAHEIATLQASGASPEAMAAKHKELTDMSSIYKNPLMNSLMTYAEILPVGLLVTLICSFILKRKN